ncbi:MAG TPA: tetratricopeptide repeat protein [Thermoanaerobaculia bacterium]|nr:tetratricopeptide repeat protein [Thermoanaerobaculia bacterium]
MTARVREASWLAAILGLALVLRLAHWAAVRKAPFVAELAMDGREYDRWAREIAGGNWLGTGVFFQAPLYPYLLAGLYAVVGHHLDAVYLAQIGLAVAASYALYRAGREMAGPRAGLAAAALAAIYGPFLFYDVQVGKESPAVAVTCFLLWALAAARARPSSGRWLAAGLLLGVLTLLRENALLALPFLLPLAWPLANGAPPLANGTPPLGNWTSPLVNGRVAGLARRCAALLAGVALALAPVALRNGLVGGDYLPTTSQGGVNFYIGNNPRADGTYRPVSPGKQIPELERQQALRIAERALGRRLTPAEASRFWLGKALSWAAVHPGSFLRLQLRKLGMFWSWYEWPDAVDYYWVRSLSPVFRLPLLELGGAEILALAGLTLLALRRPAPPALAPPLLFALGWTVSTVLFFLFSRYRLPVLPALLLIGALPLAGLSLAASRQDQNAAGKGGAGARVSKGLAAALGAAVVVAVAAPRLAGFAPRMDLVHYNLGRLAEEKGDSAAARAHYQAVLAIDPHDFLACLNLGSDAARRRDWPAALRLYSRAAALEPASDAAHGNLGGVYLALGQLGAAERHLQRALALDPDNLQALHNLALLRLRQGDLRAATELERRVLVLDPGNPAALRLRRRLAATPPR